MIKKVTLIGSGNVAHNLGLELINQGIEITEVYSRNLKNAKKLADKLNSNYTSDLSSLNSISDLYIIASSDDAIEKIAGKLHLKNKILVHTSGSVDIEILKEASNNYGSFYPLQTFTKSHLADFSAIPFCLEANNKESLKSLTQLANKMSKKVLVMDSLQRKKLHLAAVFASNFSNYMQVIAEDICESQEIDFDLLKPLIQEVFEKNATEKALNNLTGPAKRGDEFTMEKHLELMKGDKKKQELYSLISGMIEKRFEKTK